MDGLRLSISGTYCTVGGDIHPKNPSWQDFYCNGDGIVGKDILIEKNVKSRIAMCGLKIWGQKVFDSTMASNKSSNSVYLNSIE